MASLHVENRGGKRYYRVQFYDRDRQRRSIRLGAVSQKAAETIRSRIADLNSSSISGAGVETATARWLADIGDDLAEKLANAGLMAKRESACLGEFVDEYIASRVDAKPNTIRNFKNTRQKLVAFFGEERDLRTITPGECDSWRQKLLQDGCAEAVISKAVKHSRQFFKVAVRRALLQSNPFADVKGGSERNEARLRFIDRATIDKVLEEAPDVEWQAIIALARFGGLRTPSETLSLKWCDIDWTENRMTVPAPKTERHGKAYRVVPLFPELRTYLEDAHEVNGDKSAYVVARYRDADANLRTQFLRILKRAGVEAWPRLFHNLRASRQTELADTFPAHVVAAWLGNSPQIAERHYLSTTEQHFQRAVAEPAGGGATGGAVVVQKPVLHASASMSTRNKQTPVGTGVASQSASPCNRSHGQLVPPRGVEPLLPD